uniref:Transposase InsH N-terminal domain-containing protein n=1 Tax=blood disease bacterium R229 TaxID=741978 RepID=G2ZXU1_9RALS|nr:hypothetical protein BDB_mp80045 [blood disease bacterium R229]
MGPKAPETERDLFRQPLREQINLKHPLVRLADLIDWDRLSTAMSESFVSKRGRPATSARLIAGLLYLQHAFDLSDEEVVWQWVENPYWAGLHRRDVPADRAADRPIEPDALA